MSHPYPLQRRPLRCLARLLLPSRAQPRPRSGMVEVIKKRIIGRSVVFCEKVSIHQRVSYHVEAYGNDWRVWKKIFGNDRDYALHVYQGYCVWAWIIEALGQDPVAVRVISWLMYRMFK